jgi:hypothetical protein
MPTFPIYLFCGTLLMLSACGNGHSTAENPPPTDTLTLAETPADPESLPAGAPAPENTRKNVLDYFRELRPPYAPGYALHQKGNQWVSQSFIDVEIEATVDIPNGFIEINDEGTGDGFIKTQLVLFRMADGQPVLALSKQTSDGIGLSQQYYFLRPEDTKQYDWTDYTLPRLTAFDFLPLDYAEEADIVEEALPVYIELPRQGTTLTAHVFTGKKFLYCGETASARQEIACPVFDRLLRTSLPLKWDRVAGRFPLQR